MLTRPTLQARINLGMCRKYSHIQEVHDLVATIVTRKKAGEHNPSNVGKVFKLLDINGDGKVSVDELNIALKATGMDQSGREIAEQQFESLASSSGEVTLQSLKLAMAQEALLLCMTHLIADHLLIQTYEIRRCDLVASFTALDQGNKGYVSVDDLKFVRTQIGDRMQDGKLEDMFQWIDKDGDDKLNQAPSTPRCGAVTNANVVICIVYLQAEFIGVLMECCKRDNDLSTPPPSC